MATKEGKEEQRNEGKIEKDEKNTGNGKAGNPSK